MTARRRAHRLNITLSPGERDALAQLAHRSRQPQATTAARLLRAALADHGAALDAAVQRRTAPTPPAEPGAGVGWLPPARCAVAIEALRDRYPHELRRLPADPLADALLAEQLAALARWRKQLDAGDHADPRMELAFAHELRDFATWLHGRARGVR